MSNLDFDIKCGVNPVFESCIDDRIFDHSTFPLGLLVNQDITVNAFRTIQDAIDTNSAMVAMGFPAQPIYIAPGTYNDPITITENTSLIALSDASRAQENSVFISGPLVISDPGSAGTAGSRILIKGIRFRLDSATHPTSDSSVLVEQTVASTFRTEIQFYNCAIQEPSPVVGTQVNSLTVDSTNHAGVLQVFLDETQVSGSTAVGTQSVFTGPDGILQLLARNSVFGSVTWNSTSSSTNLFQLTSGCTISSAALIDIAATAVGRVLFDNVMWTGTSRMTYDGSGGMTVKLLGNNFFDIAGTTTAATGIITVASSSAALFQVVNCDFTATTAINWIGAAGPETIMASQVTARVRDNSAPLGNVGPVTTDPSMGVINP